MAKFMGGFHGLSLFMLGLFQDFQDEFNEELAPGTFHQLLYNNSEVPYSNNVFRG